MTKIALFAREKTQKIFQGDEASQKSLKSHRKAFQFSMKISLRLKCKLLMAGIIETSIFRCFLWNTETFSNKMLVPAANNFEVEVD